MQWDFRITKPDRFLDDTSGCCGKLVLVLGEHIACQERFSLPTVATQLEGFHGSLYTRDIVYENQKHEQSASRGHHGGIDFDEVSCFFASVLP
jgi:hypothetical protein